MILISGMMFKEFLVLLIMIILLMMLSIPAMDEIRILVQNYTFINGLPREQVEQLAKPV